MIKVRAGLRPIAARINLPTVLKTAILPGDSSESLFIATQPGEIFCVANGTIRTFLDIRPRIIKLGVSNGGYDERGLLGLAFHPQFYYNGLFYLHYSVAGTQGPGALLPAAGAQGRNAPSPTAGLQGRGAYPSSTRTKGGALFHAAIRQGHRALPEFFNPDPCDPGTLNLKWVNREVRYDHIDTVEEWILQSNGQPQKRRTLLNLRRPFFNHNGVNSLNFSPETGRLVLTTGDGGSGYDPFNLAQDDMEIAGKIIEIDITKNTLIQNHPAATRFDELPATVRETLTVIAKGVRNITGVSYQRHYNQYIKYVGIVGQDLVESIFSFIQYNPIPVPQLIKAYQAGFEPDPEGFINFGWRGWEGAFPASIARNCPANPALNEKTIAYYDEAIETSEPRILPLACYFHKDPRPGKFGGTALTGVQPYIGSGIPGLTGSIVFTDLARKENNQPPARGVLAYTRPKSYCKLNDFDAIDIDYDFGQQPAFFVSLGTNTDQSRLFLGVYGSMSTTDSNLGTVFEVISR
ncbi:MAG: glucose dehydrogenase [Bacillota bacterium]